jgi:hypothetical protein
MGVVPLGTGRTPDETRMIDRAKSLLTADCDSSKHSFNSSIDLLADTQPVEDDAEDKDHMDALAEHCDEACA